MTTLKPYNVRKKNMFQIEEVSPVVLNFSNNSRL
ncbi:hypothetical protein OIU84_011618 [Salix udensis]|uniref:Uncharacterized protein n=1 Tax=Salix udensis TaxID=889485 RepID=A0AAD6JNK8_9ROSI|nr:hypothetical protein OIU84_011618 [Salix udensis]